MAASPLRRKVYVVGVGMTNFLKPGSHSRDYPDLAAEAVNAALKDAGLKYSDVNQAYVGYVYGDSTCGQRALYEVGMTGIPIFNVNNNCSTGASALMLANQAIAGGLCDVALALGFEKMEKGSLSSKFDDRTSPVDKHVGFLNEKYGFQPAPPAAQMFGAAGKDHMKRYGTTREQFAKIALKNRKHAINNPCAQFQSECTLDEILNSRMVYDPLTKLQCCPTSDGSAAGILTNEDFVKEHGLQNQAVEILAIDMATDVPSTFKEDCIKMVGYDLTKKAAESVYRKTGLTPKDIDVIELHDCFSTNELITYEALGLCPEGKGGELVDRGDNTYGGKYVINPSGGLISKGHPLGATGLAQCTELCWQLRNLAGRRQVPNARIALQHNLGLGGAAVVALYKKGFSDSSSSKMASKL